jgi:DNA polymerase-3 subunit chi
VIEALFYHLERRSLEQVLPELLERTLARGKRALVVAPSPERLDALDAHLWTYADDAFLPHGRAGGPSDADQPVLLAQSGEQRPNGATFQFLVDGAPIPERFETLERLVLIFDGRDADAVSLAREQWSSLRKAGAAASYWQQEASGRWQKKA